MEIDGANFPFSKSPNLLRISWDEQLDFKEHISRTETKAIRVLHLIHGVKDISGVGTKKVLQLYTV